jgi:hypothetical protein
MSLDKGQSLSHKRVVDVDGRPYATHVGEATKNRTLTVTEEVRIRNKREANRVAWTFMLYRFHWALVRSRLPMVHGQPDSCTVQLSGFTSSPVLREERTESKQSLLVSTCLLRANVCAPRCSSSENAHCSSAVALSQQQQQQKLAYQTPEPESCGVMLLEIDPIGSSAIGRTARPHEKLGEKSGSRQVGEGGFPWRGGEGWPLTTPSPAWS